MDKNELKEIRKQKFAQMEQKQQWQDSYIGGIWASPDSVLAEESDQRSSAS